MSKQPGFWTPISTEKGAARDVHWAEEEQQLEQFRYPDNLSVIAAQRPKASKRGGC